MSDRRSRTVGRGLALLGAALLALAACASLPSTATLPERHPEELDKGRAVCTDCHDAQGEITYGDFNHRNDWASAHRLRTYGQERVSFFHAQPAPGLVEGISAPDLPEGHGVLLEEWPRSLRAVAEELGALAARDRP